MQAVWKNIFKKKPKLRLINLQQAVEVYKICKPFLEKDFEPYLLAEKIYTVSSEKSKKLYRIFYGVDCTLEDSVSINVANAFGFTTNQFGEFVRFMRK